MCDVKNLDAVVRLVVAVGHNEIGAVDDKLARAGNPSRSAYTWKVGKVLNCLLVKRALDHILDRRVFDRQILHG